MDLLCAVCYISCMVGDVVCLLQDERFQEFDKEWTEKNRWVVA
jgi:hypothetical protein